MRCVCVALLFLAAWNSAASGQDLPRSLDPRIKIELFAEQPLIATPTGLDVDSRGRVWAIECNTHFRPENYPGHPSDRILVFNGRDEAGRASTPTVFADGFTATMSVAVRPVWLPPVRLPGIDQGDDAALAKTTQVFVATRNQILLLEDVNHDDVADRRTVLFELDTKGDYPHNGFAGFAFDALGEAFVGMGENLGEPYKVRDRSGAVVYEHDEGGHVYKFHPDGTNFRLWADGFWNPHASCFDAFGRMFSVDNDPDSRPPCRLLHVVEGGDYGYHFKNGRKGLHPFTSWNGELPGTLPMVAGTGEAPSGVIAYEHDALPVEYRGHLFATSWGDHRLDVFRLKPRGLSFESVAEPVIVGGENFRPVGLALAPDGSLYCTDWVLRDYKLHGKGRIWRISAVGGTSKTPDLAAIQNEERPGILDGHLESPIGLVRRLAARRMGDLNGLKNVAVVRDPNKSERARYEALAAIVVGDQGDEPRQLRDIFGPKEPPFDSTFALMSHFGEQPSLQRVQLLLKDLNGSDPMYVLGGIRAFIPLMRTASGNPGPRIVELLNQSIEGMDPFASTALVRNCAADLSEESLIKIVQSPAMLSPRMRLAALLSAKRQNPANEIAVKAGLERGATIVRRAALQWAGEQRLKSVRPKVEECLTRTPTDRDVFLSTVAALEMIDGKDPKDFDKTPAGQYITPLLKNEKAPPTLIVEALRLADPDDPVLTIDRYASFLRGESISARREALRTLGFRKSTDAIPLLIEQAAQAREQLNDAESVSVNRSTPKPKTDDTTGMDALLGLILQFDAQPADERLRKTLLDLSKNSLAATSAFRGGRASDPATAEHLKKLYAEWGKPIVPSFGAQPDIFEVQQRSALVFGETPIRPWADKQPVDWRNEHQSPGRPPENVGHGRLVFFHPNGPGCSRCHTIDGRGGKVGPDLSKIGASFTVSKLIDSILEPSKEVSPQFTNWQMVHIDGRVFAGMLVHENEGKTILGDNEGKTIELKTAEIEERRPVKTSVMPEKLVDRVTVQEWRDLLSFLQSCK